MPLATPGRLVMTGVALCVLTTPRSIAGASRQALLSPRVRYHLGTSQHRVAGHQRDVVDDAGCRD